MIVFVGSSEEAAWPPGTTDEGRQFTFLPEASLPTVTGMTAEFQPENHYHVKIDGTGFTDTDPSTVEVFIGGVAQEVVSVSGTEIIVKVIDIPAGETAQTVEIYTKEGVPNGMTSSPFAEGITFPAQLVDVSTSVGSEEGAVIYAHVEGRGIEDNVTLVNPSGTDICASSRMVEYGLLECTVTPGVKATETMRAMDRATGTAAPETATAVNNQFGTAVSGSGPEFNAIAVSPDGKEVTFTGENFVGFGPDCQVTMAGVNSTSCTLTPTGATATFENGIPVTATAAVPELALIQCGTFTKSSSCGASNAANGFEKMNRISATPTSTVEGIVNVPTIPGGGAAGEGIITPSSFGGGAEQTIQAPGLKASILAGKAKVEICGRPCVMTEALSTSDQVVCETPSIQTTASVSQFTIEDSGSIKGEL